jgi:hypothetical protein
MTEVALVVPSRNKLYDFTLLTRLLFSLQISDFPKEYPLFATVGYGWGARRDSIDRALKVTDAEYILVSDNDVYVPTLFWNEIMRIFKIDERIGVVNPLVNNNTLMECHPNRTHQFPEPDEDITEYKRPDELHDGFVVFKRQFLLDTGVRDSRFNPDGVGNWKMIVSNRISVWHDKGEASKGQLNPHTYQFQLSWEFKTNWNGGERAIPVNLREDGEGE